MSTTIVWLMVALGTSSNWNMGPEFTSKERCEVAAKAVYKAVDEARWGTITKTPICVKIEK